MALKVQAFHHGVRHFQAGHIHLIHQEGFDFQAGFGDRATEEGQHRLKGAQRMSSPTETGLKMSNAFGYSERPWNSFAKWKENKNLLLLYYSDVLHILLPKRFFGDAQQVEFVRARLQENKVSIAGRSRRLMVVVFVVLLLVMCVLIFQFRTSTP